MVKRKIIVIICLVVLIISSGCVAYRLINKSSSSNVDNDNTNVTDNESNLDEDNGFKIEKYCLI